MALSKISILPIFTLCVLLLATMVFAVDRYNPSGATTQGNQDPCYLPAESGVCYAYFPRFYYDAREDKCKSFVYGGCGGNANRFDTEQECGKFRYRCLRKRGKLINRPF